MGAGSAFKNDKNRPSCTYPLGSYMYEVGWKKSIFFTKMLLFFESNAFPAPPAVFPGRPCPRNMASKKVPVEVTCWWPLQCDALPALRAKQAYR